VTLALHWPADGPVTQPGAGIGFAFASATSFPNSARTSCPWRGQDDVSLHHLAKACEDEFICGCFDHGVYHF
jgi:hypothetical protein